MTTNPTKVSIVALIEAAAAMQSDNFAEEAQKNVVLYTGSSYYASLLSFLLVINHVNKYTEKTGANYRMSSGYIMRRTDSVHAM